MIMSESRTKKYSSVGFAILNHWLSTQGLFRIGYLHQTGARDTWPEWYTHEVESALVLKATPVQNAGRKVHHSKS